MTRTYAILRVSRACWNEIAGKLRDAGHGRALIDHPEGQLVDMHGLALQAEGKPSKPGLDGARVR